MTKLYCLNEGKKRFWNFVNGKKRENVSQQKVSSVLVTFQFWYLKNKNCTWHVQSIKLWLVFKITEALKCFFFFMSGGRCKCLRWFRVNITGLRKWVSYRLGRPTLRQNKVLWKTVSLWEQTSSLEIAKWNFYLSCVLPPPGLRKTQCMFVHLNPLPFNLSGLWFLDIFPCCFFASMLRALCCLPSSCIRLLSHPTCASRQRKAHSLFSIKITLPS